MLKSISKEKICLHGGAHKINNTLGQALLAKKMKKKRIIAETGAGQHGVATAMACAALRNESRSIHGIQEIQFRQKQNVFRMNMLGCQSSSSKIRLKNTKRCN